jgi:drug/metabolite transporter (DMT)-like permease
MSRLNKPWSLFALLSVATFTTFSCNAFQQSLAALPRVARRRQPTALKPRYPLKPSSKTPHMKMTGGASEESSDSSSILDGRGLLCLVALLYGTLNVSLRLVYQLPDPPTASALSAARGWLASLCFVPLLASNRSKQQQTVEESTSSSSLSSPLLWAGLELAIWNFLAQGLLNVGLLSTGSARASFLTQTSVLFTPVISLVCGQSVPSTVWIGCAIALVGLTLLSGGGAAGGMALAFSTGDWLVLGGALSWSMYLFRLSKIGSKFDEINLQAIKSTIVAVLYSVWFGFSLWKNPATSFGWVTHLAAWGALFYSALGPGTVADILQQKGQKHVSASEANVILSMEPVFAALCAWLLLGEVTSLQETLGGGLILVAALVATR